MFKRLTDIVNLFVLKKYNNNTNLGIKIITDLAFFLLKMAAGKISFQPETGLCSCIEDGTQFRFLSHVKQISDTF